VIEDLVPDGLWERVEPLLPPPRPPRHRYPGRRPIGDRAALAGIVFVLKTGIAWNQLPTGLVGCSGITCSRRPRDRTEAGVWPALHELLLAELRATDRLDLDRCAVDGSHIRALKGGTTSAPRRPDLLPPPAVVVKRVLRDTDRMIRTLPHWRRRLDSQQRAGLSRHVAGARSQGGQRAGSR
jgi:transposase